MYEKYSLSLERRLGGQLTFVTTVISIIGLFICYISNPESITQVTIFIGFGLIILWCNYFNDFSEKNNIFFTLKGIFFRDGMYLGKKIYLDWDDVGKINPSIDRSTTLGSNNSFKIKTGIIIIQKKGEDKKYTIKYSHLGGRHVVNHTGFFNTARASDLIKSLRDATSCEERKKIFRESTGIPIERCKHRQQSIPFEFRVMYHCKNCDILLCYDKRVDISEIACHSCHHNDLVKS